MTALIHYGSGQFPAAAEACLAQHRPLRLLVTPGLEQRLLRAHLPYLLEQRLDQPSLRHMLLATLLLGEFHALFARAHDRSAYTIDYRDLDDGLLISFQPQ